MKIMSESCKLKPPLGNIARGHWNRNRLKHAPGHELCAETCWLFLRIKGRSVAFPQYITVTIVDTRDCFHLWYIRLDDLK